MEFHWFFADSPLNAIKLQNLQVSLLAIEQWIQKFIWKSRRELRYANYSNNNSFAKFTCIVYKIKFPSALNMGKSEVFRLWCRAFQ